MISSRYLPAIGLMLALVLVPTIIHSYAGVVDTDGRSARAIATSLAGFESTRGGRNAEFIGGDLASDDWIERTYTSGRDEMRLTVARSYDWKRLYHHPELAIAHGVSLQEHQITRMSQKPGIPVHVLRGDGGLVLYVLDCDGQFVEEPVSFQLRAAGLWLFSPRKAMTLFFLRSLRTSGGDDGMRRSADLLFAAIESFGASGSR